MSVAATPAIADRSEGFPAVFFNCAEGWRFHSAVLVVVAMPVVVRQVRKGQTVQKTVEVPQLQCRWTPAHRCCATTGADGADCTENRRVSTVCG